MSDNASRVLSFIQRAKKLTEVSRSVTEMPVRQSTPVKSSDTKFGVSGNKCGNAQKAPVKKLSRPPTPKISSVSRSETPKSRNSPIGPFCRSPVNSEIITKFPLDGQNLQSSIESLLKIRADIEEKIKEQQMKELQIIQNVSNKLQKVEKVQDSFKTVENAERVYKQKYEQIVSGNKEKLREMEQELKEIEDENKRLRGAGGKKVRVWKRELGFDVKVRNESELETVVDEQIVYLIKELGKFESEKVQRELCVVLGKKLLLEQQRVGKLEVSAGNILRQEEGLISLLEERIKGNDKA